MNKFALIHVFCFGQTETISSKFKNFISIVLVSNDPLTYKIQC